MTAAVASSWRPRGTPKDVCLHHASPKLSAIVTLPRRPRSPRRPTNDLNVPDVFADVSTNAVPNIGSLEERITDIQSQQDSFGKTIAKVQEWVYAEQAKQRDSYDRRTSVSGGVEGARGRSATPGLESLRDRIGRMEDKHMDFVKDAEAQVQTFIQQAQALVDGQFNDVKESLARHSSRLDNVSDKLKLDQEMLDSNLKKHMKELVEAAKDCNLQVWQAVHASCRGLDERSTRLEAHTDEVRLAVQALSSLDTQSLMENYQSQQESEARLQERVRDLDTEQKAQQKHLARQHKNQAKASDERVELHSRLCSLGMLIKAHGLFVDGQDLGAFAFGTRLHALELRLDEDIGPQLGVVKAAASQDRESLDQALQAPAKDCNMLRDAMAALKSEVDLRVLALEVDKVRKDTDFEEVLRTGRQFETLYRRFDLMEQGLVKLHKVPTLAAVAGSGGGNRCMFCHSPYVGVGSSSGTGGGAGPRGSSRERAGEHAGESASRQLGPSGWGSPSPVQSPLAVVHPKASFADAAAGWASGGGAVTALPLSSCAAAPGATPPKRVSVGLWGRPDTGAAASPPSGEVSPEPRPEPPGGMPGLPPRRPLTARPRVGGRIGGVGLG
mmetsp:Transcript_133145/g.425972  ORF Transcript_133145/g.425972 Transcript_133145/m.425972 type:complete len:612 (-) Transcript_133145:402-2237(-)